MAKAPSAAAANRARAKADGGPANTTVQLKWQGRDLSFSSADLGPGDDAEARRQSGYPVMGLLQELRDGAKIGTDILAMLVWVGRRKHGEPDLLLSQVYKDVGGNDQFMSDLELGPAAAADGALDVGEAEPPGE